MAYDGNHPRPIIIFDGVCNLCNGAVNFVLDRDRSKAFRFTPFQSRSGQQLLRWCKISETDPKTLVLVEGSQCRTKSDAVLGIAARLGFPWSIARVFTMIPRPLRDVIYDVVAARRYHWFGRRNSCRVPTPEVRDRFLS